MLNLNINLNYDKSGDNQFNCLVFHNSMNNLIVWIIAFNLQNLNTFIIVIYTIMNKFLKGTCKKKEYPNRASSRRNW